VFVDSAKIVIASGRGGDGAVSFRREPFVPNGGPNGGNGGKGGDVIFVADRGLNTLMDLRYMKKYKAQAGRPGEGSNRYGKNGSDLEIRLPVGSVIIDDASDAFMADLCEDGMRFVAAYGGKGGLGNSHFKNSVRQAPNFAEAGTAGQERTVRIELKLLADVGLVGLPNAGKSTFLAATTAARPKIADYRFTTLSPNLGVVSMGYSSFVIADIPGLIKGAAAGAGLGHEFLKHIERTRVLIHLVDASGFEGRTPLEDFLAIEKELAEYSPLLMKKKRLVALNKMDAADEDGEALREIEGHLKEQGLPYFKISAVAKSGVSELLAAVAAMLEEVPRDEGEGDETGGAPITKGRLVFRPQRTEDEPDYREIKVQRESDGTFVLAGKQLEKIFDSTNFGDYGSLRYFDKYLEANGAIRKMKSMGLKEGDTIRIRDFEMEYFDDEG
jgi:GTP-binding protein